MNPQGRLLIRTVHISLKLTSSGYSTPNWSVSLLLAKYTLYTRTKFVCIDPIVIVVGKVFVIQFMLFDNVT